MDRALLARVERQAWYHRYPRGGPILLFVLTAMVTLLSVVAIERANRQSIQSELDRNVTEIASGIQRRAAENLAILAAGGALFETRAEVSHQDFSDFSSGLYSQDDYHGSLGMGWARAMDAMEVPTFEQQQRAIYPDYTVRPWPVLDQNRAVPVTDIDPLTPSNRAALGFDMYSEPVRRRAMDDAIRLRQPVMSGKLTLINTPAETSSVGFLVFMPVFEQGSNRQRIKGFVYSPFRADDFLEATGEFYRNRQVEIALYDEAIEPDRLLAWRQVPGESGLSLSRAITVGTRNWIVRVSVKEPAALSVLSRVILLFGTVLGLMIALVARFMLKKVAEDREVLEFLTHQAAIRNSLTRELNHRVKNTLANVLSIVALTRRRATGIDDFAESLGGRIRALSATHDLLSQSDWTNAPIDQVIKSELAPYMAEGESHVVLSGPEISLAPNDALSLGLAIHELATNAAKYGAFSVADGKVSVEWTLATPDRVDVHWREEGGPAVAEPSNRGFGRDLIEKIVAQELKSEVDLRFDPAGVQCTLRVPVRRLSGDFMLRKRPESALS